MTRILLLRPPKGGLPGVNATDRLLAKVPIYGTSDAGRGFWRNLRIVLTGAGWKESKILKACYYITDDQGKLQGILASHVDDLIWAVTKPYENVMIEFGKLLIFGKLYKRNF